VPRRTLLLAAAAALVAAAPRSAAAQAAPAAQPVIDVKAAAHFRDAYLEDLDTVRSKVMALANAIPADKYAWRPAAGVRSISEVLMHVAGEWYFFTPMSLAGKAPADFGAPREALAKLERIADKGAVLAELEKSWAHGRAQVAGADPATLTGTYRPWNSTLSRAAFGMSGDLHEHLGQLVTYARSVGVKPPWSR
jgi:uncharacterized damage-inducible protein DinB